MIIIGLIYICIAKDDTIMGISLWIHLPPGPLCVYCSKPKYVTPGIFEKVDICLINPKWLFMNTFSYKNYLNGVSCIKNWHAECVTFCLFMATRYGIWVYDLMPKAHMKLELQISMLLFQIGHTRSSPLYTYVIMVSWDLYVVFVCFLLSNQCAPHTFTGKGRDVSSTVCIDVAELLFWLRAKLLVRITCKVHWIISKQDCG